MNMRIFAQRKTKPTELPYNQLSWKPFTKCWHIWILAVAANSAKKSVYMWLFPSNLIHGALTTWHNRTERESKTLWIKQDQCPACIDMICKKVWTLPGGEVQLSFFKLTHWGWMSIKWKIHVRRWYLRGPFDNVIAHIFNHMSRF